MNSLQPQVAHEDKEPYLAKAYISTTQDHSIHSCTFYMYEFLELDMTLYIAYHKATNTEFYYTLEG